MNPGISNCSGYTEHTTRRPYDSSQRRTANKKFITIGSKTSLPGSGIQALVAELW